MFNIRDLISRRRAKRIADREVRRFLNDPPAIEFEEHEAMVDAAPAFLTMMHLFAAAAQGANRDERRALNEVRVMISQRRPLPEIGQAILNARGSDWTPPDEVMKTIEAINRRD